MQGSVYPGCDPDTGECLCRPGVTGNFCEKCAPGHNSIFPACEPCHPCNNLWGENVTDILKVVENMQSLLSKHGENLVLSDKKHLEKIKMLNETFKSMVSMQSHEQDDLGSIENFLNQIRCS